MKDDSQSDLSEEINDQLNQLWTNAKDKRKELLSHLTGYSKQNRQSLNSSIQPKGYRERQLGSSKAPKESESSNLGLEREVIRLRDQLEQEVLHGRHKDIELERLKKTAHQLSMEKKYLVKEIQQTRFQDENNSKVLNQSSILPRGKSASEKKRKHKQERSTKQIRQTIRHTNDQTIEKYQDISKQRLLDLVRSTYEYRSYVYYYDSNELSYLKRLNDQHKKNCQKPPGLKERQYWAPQGLVEELRVLNLKEGMDLTEQQIQLLVSRLKAMFEANCSVRLGRLKQKLENRLKKAQRVNQNSIPYDLMQVARAKQRDLSRWSSTKRSGSLFK